MTTEKIALPVYAVVHSSSPDPNRPASFWETIEDKVGWGNCSRFARVVDSIRGVEIITDRDKIAKLQVAITKEPDRGLHEIVELSAREGTIYGTEISKVSSHYCRSLPDCLEILDLPDLDGIVRIKYNAPG